MKTLRRPTPECLATDCTQPRSDGKHCAKHAAQRWDTLHHTQTPAERRERYGKDWQRTRHQVLTRDGRACVVCGSAYQLEVHHIHGTTHQLDHLATLCHRCHSAARSERVRTSINAWIALVAPPHTRSGEHGG
jgi:5-methylcytosine-specific restriction endonuclease McrA